jgi:hypothetical protein
LDFEDHTEADDPTVEENKVVLLPSLVDIGEMVV